MVRLYDNAHYAHIHGPAVRAYHICAIGLRSSGSRLHDITLTISHVPDVVVLLL